MKQKSRVLNGILVLILFLLLAWGADQYLNPEFPSKIRGESILPGHRVLEVPKISQGVYSKAIVGEVVRLNLFRKERTKYYQPNPPKPKPRIKPAFPMVALAPPPPPKPTAPPPQLILTGVLLFDGQQVAIFEGTYSEIRGGKLVQNLKPRRSGYKIGESLGGYKIEKIEKKHATLTALTGSHLKLTISKTHPNQKIQKTGNRLAQKSKPVLSQSPVTTPPPPKRRLQQTPNQRNPMHRTPPRVGSPSQPPPPVLSLPGSATVPPPRPVPNIPLRLKQKSMGF